MINECSRLSVLHTAQCYLSLDIRSTAFAVSSYEESVHYYEFPYVTFTPTKECLYTDTLPL